MIYIRKIFKQDLREGKQIAFPIEPSNLFFNFDYKIDQEKRIEFIFKEENNENNVYQFRNKNIKTRLYAARSESRIDAELQSFLKHSLNAEIGDILVFKNFKNSNYEFHFISHLDSTYNIYLDLLNNKNHSIVLAQNKITNNEKRNLNKGEQIIFFGSPGTGKSHKVKTITEGKHKTVVTFHPDTDYSSFIGSYKPTLHTDGKTLTYKFVAQAFAISYVNAWNNIDEDYFLVIEEINRGNCAQIFGDIFQLLDRNIDGFSDYVIDVDEDFASFLKNNIKNKDNYINNICNIDNINIEDFSFSKITIPSNLRILATMNTSDQSLFPMDSAFKRRWDWEYVPIDYSKAEELQIHLGENKYNWGVFIKIINIKIKELCNSEDKQLGTYFVKTSNKIISFEQFRSKVMFYLWFEIYKDEIGTTEYIFKTSDDDASYFTYADLFSDKSISILKAFMAFLTVPPLAK